jgi:hypothetical protein
MAAEDWIPDYAFESGWAWGGYWRPRRGVSTGAECRKCGTYCTWKSYTDAEGHEKFRLMDGKKPHRCNVEEMLD